MRIPLRKVKSPLAGHESPSLLGEIVQKNVETIARIEQAAQRARKPIDRVADRIAGFCGSLAFVWVHCIWFATWIIVNWLPMFRKTLRFDPPPFGILTLIAALEAIFLSTFILISQNRQQKIADQRNQLDLQINLLAEQEASEIIVMLGRLLDFHGISLPTDKGHALKAETDAEKLAESIESHIADE